MSSSHLSNHLAQISLTSTSLLSLSFPPTPARFTNALLSPAHDITRLIRDTEPHERALYQNTTAPRRKTNIGVGKEVGVGGLLDAASKLVELYPALLPDVAERMEGLRRRHDRVESSVRDYEDRVSRNARELGMLGGAPTGKGVAVETEGGAESVASTREDLRRVELEIRQLEDRKRGLEGRVEGLARDLGGVEGV